MKEAIDMSKIDEYITKRSQKSTVFAREYKEENQQLQVAVVVHNLRDKLDMSQHEIGKPQLKVEK